jgi:hypothetical protein
MALRLFSNDGVTATGFDSATGARGFLKKGINRTGGNSDTHFKECGHACQSTSASAGVSNLVLCELHFN